MASAATEPVILTLDASQVSRGVIYARERIPVSPGALTLVYPKWIPGEHGPTGPLANLAALRISAGGSPVEWHRDQVDMYAFHLIVPRRAQAIDVEFEVLVNGTEAMATPALAILNWNQALLYQDGANSHDYMVKPSIVVPQGWGFATALRDPVRSANRIDFAATSLEMLVDSPLDFGRYAKKWNLWREGDSFVQLDAFADDPKSLDIPAPLLEAYQRVPAETFALYGSRHFTDYHALLTLSDEISIDGIEHHQSGDDRVPSGFFTDPQWLLLAGDLVTHEFSHSWNGKFRRPADLTTRNFQVPERTDLLWVYEGMNKYLGDLLSFRSGIRKPSEFPELVASTYARLDNEGGRPTTPLIDLTTGAPYYFMVRGQYSDIRRGAGDAYAEGELVWLDVDTIIRERSGGARSLDTFLHRFTEPSSTGPMVVTYTREQIEQLLDGVQPYDWHAFFDKYVYHIDEHPPTDELARAGWKLVYTDKPNTFIDALQSLRHVVTHWFDIGLVLDPTGTVISAREDSPAWKAGMGPDMRIVAIDHQRFTPKGLNDAIDRASHSNTPISLVVIQARRSITISVDYHGGIRIPHLERIDGTQDMLAIITAPHAM